MERLRALQSEPVAALGFDLFVSVCWHGELESKATQANNFTTRTHTQLQSSKTSHYKNTWAMTWEGAKQIFQPSAVNQMNSRFQVCTLEFIFILWLLVGNFSKWRFRPSLINNKPWKMCIKKHPQTSEAFTQPSDYSDIWSLWKVSPIHKGPTPLFKYLKYFIAEVPQKQIMAHLVKTLSVAKVLPFFTSWFYIIAPLQASRLYLKLLPILAQTASTMTQSFLLLAFSLTFGWWLSLKYEVWS